MKFVVKFYEEKFENEISKNAYLDACKWLAQNIIDKVEIGETLHKISKVKEASSPTFKVELFAHIDESEHINSFCNRCKEFHSSFFLNQQYNCDCCNMLAYRKQMEQKLKIKKSYRREKMGQMLND